jgi:hypothetical protein
MADGFNEQLQTVKNLWQRAGFVRQQMDFGAYGQGAPPVPKASAVARPMSPRSCSPTSPVDVTAYITRCGQYFGIVYPPANGTVGDLKAMISQSKGVPVHEQDLFYVRAGEKRLLEDDAVCLADLQDVNDVPILMFQIVVGFDINVYQMSGKAMNFHVKDINTIKYVQASIHESPFAVHPHQQRLLFGETELDDDNRTLFEYNIRGSCDIMLVVLKTFPIWVFRNRDPPVVLDVEAGNTIHEIKVMIEVQTAIPVGAQHLYTEARNLGREMENDRTISEYGTSAEEHNMWLLV